MSEFGTIVDPYRGYPSQGNVLEAIQQFIVGQQMMDTQRRMELERQASNALINQSQGWTGVDPHQVQKFDQTQQRMGIDAASEQRAAEQYAQMQRFAQQYGQNVQPMLQGSDSPYLQSFAGVDPNPIMAQAVMQALGLRDTHGLDATNKRAMLQQELQNRTELERIATQAATKRATQVAGIENTGRLNLLGEQNKLNLENQKALAEQIQAIIKGAVDDPTINAYGALKAVGATGADLDYGLQSIREARDARQKAIDDARLREFGQGEPGAIVIPKSATHAKQLTQKQKDVEHNRKLKIHEFLPPEEKEVLAREPDLVQRIKDDILTSLRRGSALEIDWKRIVPHLYAQVFNDIPSEEFKKEQSFKGMTQPGFGTYYTR